MQVDSMGEQRSSWCTNARSPNDEWSTFLRIRRRVFHGYGRRLCWWCFRSLIILGVALVV